MTVLPPIDDRTDIDDSLIAEVTRRIAEEFRPRRIILFGSHARSESQPESDLDLMIEMETSLDFYQRIQAVTALFGFRRWPLDVVVYTSQEVAEMRNVNGTLVNLIEREGKVLYVGS